MGSFNGQKEGWMDAFLVACLMSPAASLVTTDKCSNVSMCLRISTKCFFLVLFHCCILLEIKVTTTTTMNNWMDRWTESVHLLYLPTNITGWGLDYSRILVAFYASGNFFIIIYYLLSKQQGKSKGFDSCDRPSNLTQIGFKSSIFQPVWRWNLMDDPEKQ